MEGRGRQGMKQDDDGGRKGKKKEEGQDGMKGNKCPLSFDTDVYLRINMCAPEIPFCVHCSSSHIPPSLPLPSHQGTMSMVQTDVMTLTRYMIENTKQFPDAQDLEVLMSSIQVRK